jgi:hypothetical protein
MSVCSTSQCFKCGFKPPVAHSAMLSFQILCLAGICRGQQAMLARLFRVVRVFFFRLGCFYGGMYETCEGSKTLPRTTVIFKKGIGACEKGKMVCKY